MNLGAKEMKTMDEWRFCPMANYICPTARETKNELNTPRGLALTAFRAHEGYAELDSAAISAFYQCSMGGLCRTTALDESDVPALTRAVRAHMTDNDLVPQRVREARESLVTRRALDGSGAEGLITTRLPSESAYVLVGTPWMSAVHAEEYRAAEALLALTGIPYAVPPHPVDSGAVLAELGYRNDARRAAHELVSQIRAMKSSTVLFASPHDLRVLTTFAEETNLQWPSDIEGRVVTDLLSELIDDGRLSFAGDSGELIGVVEPSYAVHELKLQDARAIAAATGREQVDLRWNDTSTRTCGGASLFIADPQLSGRVVRRNLDELLANRAVDLLSSTCPLLVLEARAAGYHIPVRGILSLVYESLAERRGHG